MSTKISSSQREYSQEIIVADRSTCAATGQTERSLPGLLCPIRRPKPVIHFLHEGGNDVEWLEDVTAVT